MDKDVVLSNVPSRLQSMNNGGWWLKPVAGNFKNELISSSQAFAFPRLTTTTATTFSNCHRLRYLQVVRGNSARILFILLSNMDFFSVHL